MLGLLLWQSAGAQGYKSGLQLTPSSTPSDVEAYEKSLFYWKPGGLWRIDPATLEETFFFEYDPPPDGYLQHIQLEVSSQRIYAIESEEPPPKLNVTDHIVQLGVNSETKTDLWQSVNLGPLFISPDGDQILVLWTDHIPDDPRNHYCLLTIAEHSCKSIDISGSSIQWLNNTTLLYLGSRGIGLLSTKTFEQQEVILDQWTVHLLDAIPETNMVVGYVFGTQEENFGQHFIVYNLNTAEVALIPHTPISGPVWRMKVSPDGRFLYYGRLEAYTIVNIESGASFTLNIDAAEEAWFPDGRGMIIVAYARGHAKPETLVYVDVLSGNIRELNTYYVPEPYRLQLISPQR